MSERTYMDGYMDGKRDAEAEAVRDDEPVRLLTFAEFARVNRARCESPDGFGHPLDGWTLSDWFLAAIGEFGEAANIAKKLNRVRDGIPGNKETPDELRAKLRGEVADALIYLDLLAQSAGFYLADAVVETFNRKSEQIGAPHRLAALPDEPVGSDDAWKAAETALPEGWWIQLDHDGREGDPFRAKAGESKWSKDYQSVEVFGPTPAEALTNLAARLSSTSTERKP